MESKPTYDGELILIYGCMFSGKTTELFRKIGRYKIAGKSVLIVKSETDTRSKGNIVCTHAGTSFSTDIKAKELMKIDEKLLKECEVIGITEGQFFKDVKPFCEKMMNLGKIVVVESLGGCSDRKLIGNVYELIPLATDIVHLKAVCMDCGKDATYSRLKTGISKGNGEQVLIGGTDKYKSVCLKCYFK